MLAYGLTFAPSSALNRVLLTVLISEHIEQKQPINGKSETRLGTRFLFVLISAS